MAKILAIDTSTSACSVALALGDDIYEQYRLEPQSHTQCLLPMIDDVLTTHQISLSNLDAIALTTGPGSFTGLRIGLGIVQGLAFGADIGVIGESSLQTLSVSARRLLGLSQGGVIFPCLDARMQEVYWGCYSGGELSDVIVTDTVTAADQLLEACTKHAFGVGVGDGWRGIETDRYPQWHVVSDFYPHAYDTAVLAQASLRAGRLQDPAKIQPVYIRNEVCWKKREKIRSSL